MALMNIRPVEMARDAVQSMTDEQKIAFAIEMVNKIENPHCGWHLVRLGAAATAAGNRITRDAQLRRVR